MTDLEAFARTTREGIKAGGRFMTSREMKAAAEPLGLNRATLYLRGRAAALGEATPAVVTAVFGMFPGWVIELAWEHSRELSGARALAAYSEACSAWGRAHLGELRSQQRLSQLAALVVDGVEPSGLPLFAGWRAQPRPEAQPERAAHLVNLLRELRGGIHFAALRARGLDVPVAVVAEPTAVPSQLAKTGWTEAEIAALEQRAAAIPDLAERWQRAEDDTDAGFGQCAAALTAAERAELAEHLATFEEVSRPPAAAAAPPRSS